MIVKVERGDFWEIQARTAALDLQAVRARATLAEIGRQRNALLDTFATKHGLDPAKPMTFEDADCSVSQDA